MQRWRTLERTATTATPEEDESTPPEAEEPDGVAVPGDEEVKASEISASESDAPEASAKVSRTGPGETLSGEEKAEELVAAARRREETVSP